MKKQYIMRYLAFMILMNLYLPIVGANIPGFIFGYRFNLLLWFVAMLILYPKLYFKKTMLFGFLYLIIYILMMLIGHYDIDLYWLYMNIIPWILAISLFSYFYYFEKQKVYGTFSIILLVFIVITLITNSIGNLIYPIATRTLYTGRLDISMSLMYRKIGIASYGFFSGLAFIIPSIVYNYKMENFKLLTFIFISVIIFYSSMMASITAPLLLVGVAYIISLLGQKKASKSIFGILLLTIMLLMIPKSFYTRSLYSISEFLNNPILSQRIDDIAYGFDEGVEVGAEHQTSVEYRLSRYGLNWEQFLNNPVIGKGIEGNAHIFWMNIMAQFGLLGLLPIILIIYNQFKINIKNFKEDFRFFYLISMLIFIVLGFMKAYSGAELYINIFFLVPGMYNINQIHMKK